MPLIICNCVIALDDAAPCHDATSSRDPCFYFRKCKGKANDENELKQLQHSLKGEKKA